MKKLLYLIAFVAFVSVFASCTEEEIKPQTSTTGDNQTEGF
jgi:hypothetical protein